MRFTGTGLAVRKAGRHAALEDGLHQRLSGVLIYKFVVRVLVECVIESEHVILQISKRAKESARQLIALNEIEMISNDLKFTSLNPLCSWARERR